MLDFYSFGELNNSYYQEYHLSWRQGKQGPECARPTGRRARANSSAVAVLLGVFKVSMSLALVTSFEKYDVNLMYSRLIIHYS